MEIGGEKKEKREREGERENEDVDKRGSHVGNGIRKTVHLSGNADVVPQSGHRKRWCHNLDLN